MNYENISNYAISQNLHSSKNNVYLAHERKKYK